MSWVHVDSVDYLTKFTNQQFSRDHRTVMLSLPPAYIICILKTYIIYVILSVLYSHTHTLYIYSINIYKYTTYIFCTNTLYYPKGPQLSLPGVLFNNPHLSIAGQQPEFSVACGRHRPERCFSCGGGLATLHPPSGDTYSPWLRGPMLSFLSGNIWPNRNWNTSG